MNSADLEYMRNQVLAGKQPWKDAYDLLKEKTPLDFQVKPFAHVISGPYSQPDIGGKDLSQSARMAYSCAVLWYISREECYAEIVIDIIEKWANTLRSFDENNAKLLVALTGYEFCNAAEILRYNYPGWKKIDTENMTRLMMSAFYPTIRYYFPVANGNWDGAIMHTLLAIAVFTDNSSLSLTWILPEQAKNDLVNGGEISLGYWWSEQPSVTLNSVSVKYCVNTVSSIPEPTKNETSKEESLSYSAKSPDGSFRTSSEIVDSIKVGWNLGNSLEPFNYASITSDAELAWGNPKTTKEMIKSAKDKGFNAIRIPVTWSDHLNGNIIDSEWLDRVQQVVDYAYDLDMFVIVNMHHDDYSWFVPDKNKYAENSKKLCAIWEQISERFADYDDTLLFEGMNEPRTVGMERRNSRGKGSC